MHVCMSVCDGGFTIKSYFELNGSGRQSYESKRCILMSTYCCQPCPQAPPPEERPGTHCLRIRKIFRYIFRKKLRTLPCPYAEDYTNQVYRAFFEIDSSDDLTYRTLLRYYFSDVAVSFFQMYSQHKSVYQSGPFRTATEILVSLCTRYVAAPP